MINRLVQQAIGQVLEPILDPTFSASSYGFRPGRSAHDALKKAKDYVAEGRVSTASASGMRTSRSKQSSASSMAMETRVEN